MLSWSPDYILEKIGGIDLLRFDMLADALLALKYQRIEALAMDISDATYLCNVQPAYTMISEPVARDKYVCFVSNERPELLAQFNEFAADFYDSEDCRELQERVRTMKNGNFVSRSIPVHPDGPIIKIAILGTAMPYTAYNFTTRDYMGSDIEVARHFAWRYGYRIEFLDSDWMGSIANISTGKADLFFCALSDYYRTDTLKSHIALVSEPYFPSSIHLVVIGDRSKISFNNPDMGY